MLKNIKKVQNMDNISESILSYMGYLNTIVKISIHFKYGLYRIFNEEFAEAILPFNCHSNPHCLKLKSEDHNKCILEQQRIIEKCITKELFFNICHGGVCEYIVPLFKREECIGFIAVGEKKEKSFDTTLIDTLVSPLAIMIEKLLEELPDKSEDDFYAVKSFLSEYHTSVNLDSVAKAFNRSKSYISHMFKDKSGMSIRAYCNSLKLDDAYKAVKNTNLPITEIALNVGFNDTSHFIALFKEKFGVTPLNLRKNK